MAIRRSIDDLPEGCPPDPEPRFAHLFVEDWAAADRSLAHAVEGTRFRHSNAGACARRIAYAAAGVPQSNPMDLTGVMATETGSWLHERYQEAIQRHADAMGLQVEVEVKLQIVGFDGSGHADVVTRRHLHADVAGDDGELEWTPVSAEWVTVREAKTVGGWAFKAAIGKARRGTPAEGPKTEHLVQVALNGLALDADEVAIDYISKEALSVNVGAGLTPAQRFVAEWTFPREVYEPIARAEVERVTGILELLDEGRLPKRKIPGVPGEIVDATTARWERVDGDGALVDTGTTWNCSYCAWQEFCTFVGPGRLPAETVLQIGRGEVSPCAVTAGGHLSTCECAPCPDCGHHPPHEGCVR